MRKNVGAATIARRTHEGAIAKRIAPLQELRRTVLACMLWENTFYESGESVADRIQSLVAQCSGLEVADLAVEARTKFKLRHVPLLIVKAMTDVPSHLKYVRATLQSVIQRPDELAEFLCLYLGSGSRGISGKKRPIAASVKKGLALAFQRFSAYQLAKWNKDGPIKLRDVLFLVHPKPVDQEQAETWKQLVAGTLPTPDTWEVELSASKDKLASWNRLLSDEKLGALALLRNLRNMQQAGVSDGDIRAALSKCKTDRVLPFRFISAARYAPSLEPELEQLMFGCLSNATRLSGKTALVIDHSASMLDPLSSKSELTRFDAACALAILLREICEEVSVVAFSAPISPQHMAYYRGQYIGPGLSVSPVKSPLCRSLNVDAPSLAVVPPRRGFALRDAIDASVVWAGTNTDDALQFAAKGGYDRIIVFTDEQSQQTIRGPLEGSKAYFVNIASNKNGIGYGKWTHIDGFSEAVVDFIQEFEKQEPVTIDG